MDSPFAYPAFCDAFARLLVSEGLRDEAIAGFADNQRSQIHSLSGQLHLAQLLAEKDDETESLALVEGYPGYQHLSGPGNLSGFKRWLNTRWQTTT